MSKSLYDFCIERDEFELLVEWDKEKNGDLTPRNVSRGSEKRVWWKCAFGHSWQALIYNRTRKGADCPYCAGKPLSPQSLALGYPELSAEWHPTKNHDLTPADVSPGTHRKAWWKCTEGHEWQAEIKSRAKGAGCPICTNRKVLVGDNDLGTVYPDIATQWHPTKNGSLTPQSVVHGSERKVWWFCEKGHEWEASIDSRTRNGFGCPVCAGRVVLPGENDLASQRPHIAAQWHPTRNGSLTPQNVTVFCNRRVWWLCEKGHEYHSAIGQRSQKGTGCPYCQSKKILVGYNDLATLEPAIAAQWHQELNGSLTPQMVTVSSHKKVWWQCSEGHVWQAVIYSRTGDQKCGCPACAGRINNAKRRRYAEIDSDVTQKTK